MEDKIYETFDSRIPKHKPFITNFLIFVILFMFSIEVLLNAFYSDKTLIILGAKWNEGITRGEYWRFFTCTLLHGNLIHLLLNLTALYIFGQEVESLFGYFRFSLIYLFSSWGAALSSYAFSPNLAIGASGAVFGVIGALIIFFYKQKDKVTGAKLRLKSMYTLVIINLLLGLVLPRIDNFAHIGGVISGIFCSWIISPKYIIQENKMSKLISVIKSPDKLKTTCGIITLITIFTILTKLTVESNYK